MTIRDKIEAAKIRHSDACNLVIHKARRVAAELDNLTVPGAIDMKVEHEEEDSLVTTIAAAASANAG